MHGPIEPTIPQLESWAVSDNGASKSFNMYEAKGIGIQHWQDPRVSTCRRMILLCRVRKFRDYTSAYSKDSECIELLDCFSPAVAVHTRCPLETIKIYATKQESVRA